MIRAKLESEPHRIARLFRDYPEQEITPGLIRALFYPDHREAAQATVRIRKALSRLRREGLIRRERPGVYVARPQRPEFTPAEVAAAAALARAREQSARRGAWQKRYGWLSTHERVLRFLEEHPDDEFGARDIAGQLFEDPSQAQLRRVSQALAGLRQWRKVRRVRHGVYSSLAAGIAEDAA